VPEPVDGLLRLTDTYRVRHAEEQHWKDWQFDQCIYLRPEAVKDGEMRAFYCADGEASPCATRSWSFGSVGAAWAWPFMMPKIVLSSVGCAFGPTFYRSDG
jgi:hypothetical protein